MYARTARKRNSSEPRHADQRQGGSGRARIASRATAGGPRRGMGGRRVRHARPHSWIRRDHNLVAPLRAAAPGARLSSRNASAFGALHVRPLRHISPAVHVAQICLLFLIAAATAKALRTPSLDGILLALLQRVTARLVTPPLHATYLSLLLMRVQVVNTCGRDAAMTNPSSARAPTVAHCAARLLRSEPRVLRLQPAGLRIIPKVRAACANCHVCSVDVQCVRAIKSTQDAPIPKALLVLTYN